MLTTTTWRQLVYFTESIKYTRTPTLQCQIQILYCINSLPGTLSLKFTILNFRKTNTLRRNFFWKKKYPDICHDLSGRDTLFSDHVPEISGELEGLYTCNHVGVFSWHRARPPPRDNDPANTTSSKQTATLHGDRGFFSRFMFMNIDSLVQDCSISSMLEIEIWQSCTKPSTSIGSFIQF